MQYFAEHNAPPPAGSIAGASRTMSLPSITSHPPPPIVIPSLPPYQALSQPNSSRGDRDSSTGPTRRRGDAVRSVPYSSSRTSSMSASGSMAAPPSPSPSNGFQPSLAASSRARDQSGKFTARSKMDIDSDVDTINDIADIFAPTHTKISKHEREWRSKQPTKLWGKVVDIYKSIVLRIVQDNCYACFHSNVSSTTLIDAHGAYNGPYVLEATKRIFLEMHPESDTVKMKLHGKYSN